MKHIKLFENFQKNTASKELLDKMVADVLNLSGEFETALTDDVDTLATDLISSCFDIEELNPNMEDLKSAIVKWKESKKYNEAYNFKRKQELEDELHTLIDELSDLEKEREQLDTDMENEAGQAGDKWTDDDANRYGVYMDNKDREIEKKKKEIQKAQEIFDKFESSRKSRVIKPGDISYKILKLHIDDLKSSIKSWPNRNDKEQAEIYKKRYGISEDIPSIIIAINKLKMKKLI